LHSFSFFLGKFLAVRTKLVVVFFRKTLTLSELIDELESAEDSEIPEGGLNIGVLPPTNCNDDCTDEDSGAEDNPTIDNLPGSQLRAEVLIQNQQLETTAFLSDTDPLSDSTNTTQSQPSAKVRKRVKLKRPLRTRLPSPHGVKKEPVQKKKKRTYNYNWQKEELLGPDNEWPEMSLCRPSPDKTPLEYFKCFLDDEVITLLVKYTNQYAAKRNKLGNCTDDEMLVFIAILLLSGYVNVPRRAMYWQQNLDSHNPLVAKAMSRDRFDFIMSNLHVCNNDKLDKSDRFAKIRPLLNMLNERFMDFLPHDQNHSVDESMVPYYGVHGAKQFIRGKPIRFGMKFWCGGTAKGYLSWLEPYQGANTCTKKYAEKGLGYSVVMSYVDELPKEIPYRIFFDNLFTSIELLDDLKQHGIAGTGTIRANRIDRSCPLTEPDVMKKMERGAFDYCTDKNSGICFARWHDNNIVNIATNFDSIQPLKKVDRFSRVKKKKIRVDQPHVFNSYNKYMGGIDRADQNISLYRCGIRGKKWYFPLLAHCFDVSEQNAWQLYQADGGTMDHLEFRRHIATSILQSNLKITESRGRPSKKTPFDSRFDGLNHYVNSLPTTTKQVSTKSGIQMKVWKTQIKCRFCSKKTTTKCEKCNVGLHVECFIQFHTK